MAPARVLGVSDYTIPEPEPKEIDERLSVELGHMVDFNVLRGHPSGDERCDNCRYYLEDQGSLVLLAPEGPHPGRGELVVPMVGGDSRARAVVRARRSRIAPSGAHA